MAKKIKIGSLIVTEVQDKVRGPKKLISLGLGVKGARSEYDMSVEVIVRNKAGQVVHKQTDGFISLSDPRTEMDDLLAAGFIDEKEAEKRREQASRISPKVKYNIIVKTQD